jgi:branched-chain amino acid transport system substrate-binding protein
MGVAAARLAGCLALLVATAALAEVRIAFVGALSGPAAWAGRDQHDGFALALDERDGRLGGVAVRLHETDDRGDPARAPAIAQRLVAEGVLVVTGLTTADSALALQQQLRDQPVVLLSSGAGPPVLAGDKCSPRFFSTAPPADAVHENAGAIARTRRYRKIQLFAAPAQRRKIEAAFRRAYRGEMVWGSELREVREQRPDAVYLALPPKEMLAFLNAYEDVGLFHRIPVIAAGVEPALLESLGPAFSGLIVSARWAAGMESERSARFVDAFRAKYGRTPSAYAMQAYDAALLLDRALQKSAAQRPSANGVAKALAASRVDGVAHPIRVAANGFAATDWHAWEVFNESSGAPYLAARERTLSGYAGPQAGRCKAR